MTDVVFIGDEVSAAGYRLAGAVVHTPTQSDTQKTFDEACGHADVVMVTSQMARHIPTAQLENALVASRPLVLVVADARGHAAPPNLENHVRTILGLDL